MKKIIPLLVICLAVLCFFSSCGMIEKQIEAKYKLQGHIAYFNPADSQSYMADKCDLYIYHGGEYSIDFINSGTWERSADDPNRIYLIGHSMGAMLAPRIASENPACSPESFFCPARLRPWRTS